MKLNRRNFLAGSVGLGAAAAVLASREGASTLFAPTAGTRFLVLRSQQPQSEAFARSALSTLESAGIPAAAIAEATAPSSTDFAGWQQIADRARGTVIVGLISETDSILLNEAVREGGGRFLCRGTHVAGEGQCSRHAFDTTESSSGMGAAFARALEAVGGNALVQETAAAERAPAHEARLPAASGDWAESLGNAMARVAAGRFGPGAIVSSVQVGREGEVGSESRGWVSFAAIV